MTKIVAYDSYLGIDDESVEAIQRTAPDANVVAPTKEDLATELADAEIFYGYHSPEVFRAAKKLCWIQSAAAGLDAMVDAPLIERGLTITNASGVHAPQVAEAAWALTLALTRGMQTYFRHQQEHHWEWGTHFDLDGATAGIIGLGGIGRRYARVAAAFGMRVLAVDAHEPPRPDAVEAVWSLDRLNELLATADVVLISCPATKETHHLINAERLACIKPTSFLVNIARGDIVDEVALAESLRSGCIAGAGVDVCAAEPLPSESTLWDTPNLIITPHCAGLSPNRRRRLIEFFCQNLRRYLNDEPLLNIVDPRIGYPVPAAP
ncbi:MAG: phosphoglycerate dehydrogenase [Planctomycetaceae bacterium]|nr:phosphoglycerate dehydrogenase [Planctomycetaceae bacterium]